MDLRKPLYIVATFTDKDGKTTASRYNWNDRNDVQRFAGRADAMIRDGGQVHTVASK